MWVFKGLCGCVGCVADLQWCLQTQVGDMNDFWREFAARKRCAKRRWLARVFKGLCESVDALAVERGEAAWCVLCPRRVVRGWLGACVYR